jgi:hypothetical protein
MVAAICPIYRPIFFNENLSGTDPETRKSVGVVDLPLILKLSPSCHEGESEAIHVEDQHQCL